MTPADQEAPDRIVIVDDRLWRSIGRDVVTYGCIVTVIGTGWLLGSEAMQWCGFLILCLTVVGIAKRKPLMTAQQAADHLRDKYGVTSHDPR